METHSDLSGPLLAWYRANGRQLPWRGLADPYRVWVSEVILQQTRVAQGAGYYARFVERFPSVEALAAATEDQVLAQWQGLGYYTRARNLLRGARQVAAQHGGRFPDTAAGLLQISGIGPYTAAAIASMVYGRPELAVDGNLRRVLARLGAIEHEQGSKAFDRALAAESPRVFDPARPGDCNQALMDLGALVCLPRNPDCPRCPLAPGCAARALGTAAQLPVRRAAKARRRRFFWYLVQPPADGLYMTRRPEGDIWAGLHEFPLIEADGPGPERFAAALQARFPGESVEARSVDTAARPHVLSHQEIRAAFVVTPDARRLFPSARRFDPADPPPTHALVARWLAANAPGGR